MAITRASTDFERNQANDGRGGASRSGDGNPIAFVGDATELGTPTGFGGIFVENLTAGEIVRASRSPRGEAFTGAVNLAPLLASDGSAVASVRWLWKGRPSRRNGAGSTRCSRPRSRAPAPGTRPACPGSAPAPGASPFPNMLAAP